MGESRYELVLYRNATNECTKCIVAWMDVIRAVTAAMAKIPKSQWKQTQYVHVTVSHTIKQLPYETENT